MSLRPRSECLHSFGAASGIFVIAPAVAGQRVSLYRVVLEATVAGSFQVQDTAGTALSVVYALGVNGFFILDTPINNDPWWQSGNGQGMQIAGTGGISYVIDAWYLQGV